MFGWEWVEKVHKENFFLAGWRKTYEYNETCTILLKLLVKKKQLRRWCIRNTTVSLPHKDGNFLGNNSIPDLTYVHKILCQISGSTSNFSLSGDMRGICPNTFIPGICQKIRGTIKLPCTPINRPQTSIYKLPQ